MTSATLADLIVASKDGDWGTDTANPNSTKYAIIRGTDFEAASLGLVAGVPRRHLADRTSARRTLRANDVVIETAGGSPSRPTGRTLLIRQSLLDSFDEPVSCASFARFLRFDPTRVDPRYMYWSLQNLYNRGILETYQVQHTGVARFQYTTFAATHRFQILPLPEQKAIAEVLGALDDKIAANTRLAATADQLAHQTFRSLPKPQTMPLSKAASFINGKAFTKGASGTGRIVVRIAELNNGPGGSTVYSDAVVDEKHVATPGDVLFAWSGSLTLHRWFRDDAIVNQHIFKVIPSDDRPKWLIYELLRQKLSDFKSIAADKATTMGHIQRRHLDEPVEVPSAATLEAAHPLMQALWHTSLNTERESLTLVTTRDALLPKLMSGQLRVRDAELALSAAGV